jgi:arabinose-5-phosphate isomerase
VVGIVANGAHWLAAARRVFDIEGEALAVVRAGLGKPFVHAVELLHHCSGKVVCTGVGKSGHIARKAAATLASTGTPAFFMHPTEAGHGDVGMVAAGDVLLALSHSGESKEVLELLPALRRLEVQLVVIVGNAESALARAADVALEVCVTREACPLNLAPTASATAALALTDALALTLLEARGFSADDFARSHPSGVLGRRLLMRAGDVMRHGDDLPVVQETAPFTAALVEMTKKRMGMVLAISPADDLRGIFTDGDLRRAVEAKKDFSNSVIADLMTVQPQNIPATMLAVDALQLMRAHKLNHLAVTEGKRLVGALSFHDLLRHKLL